MTKNVRTKKFRRESGPGTKNVKKKSKAWKKAEIVSNVIQISAPPQVAVQQFNTIVNSGCFAEG